MLGAGRALRRDRRQRARSLNFNDRNVRDIDGARAFYGAVFRWEILELGPGSFMWALPAYGDFLERRTPGTRDGMASMGAPDRFERTAVSLNRIPDGDQHVSPQSRERTMTASPRTRTGLAAARARRPRARRWDRATAAPTTVATARASRGSAVACCGP